MVDVVFVYTVSRKIADNPRTGGRRIEAEQFDGVRIEAVRGEHVQEGFLRGCRKVADPGEAGARIERIPNKPAAHGRETCDRVNLARSHRARGRRVKYGAERECAPQQIASSSVLINGVNQILEVRVAAAGFESRRDAGDLRLRLADAGGLKVAEEKSLILAIVNVRDDHRPANGSAKLISPEFSFLNMRG